VVGGMSSTDWETSALADFGRTIQLERSTKVISNVTGQREMTYEAPITIQAVWCKRTQLHKYQKPGEYDDADGGLQTKISDDVKHEDRVTVDGVTYFVKRVIDRNPDGSTPLLRMCILFRTS